MENIKPIDLDYEKKSNIVSSHYKEAHEHPSGLILIEIRYGWTYTESLNGLEGDDGQAPILPIVFNKLKEAHKMLDDYHEWFDPFYGSTWITESLSRGARKLNDKELSYLGYPSAYFERTVTLE